MVPAHLEPLLGNLRIGEPERVEQLRRAGFLDEPTNPTVLIVVHNAECLGQVPADRDGRYGQFRLLLDVRRDDVAEVHPVQLIPAQDQEVLKVVVQQVNQVFTDGVSRALIPRVAGQRLLGR